MKRVSVVTGIGVLAANGRDAGEFTESLRMGRPGISPVTTFETGQYCTSGAGVVRSEKLAEFNSSPKEDRATFLAREAAIQAVQDASVRFESLDASRAGVTVGTSLGGWGSYLDALRREARGVQEAACGEPTDYIPEVAACCITAQLAEHFGIRGATLTTTTACAAGSNAISLAVDLIRQDRCDVVIAAASDPLCELSYSGFNILLAMTSGLCKPFDQDRAGLVVGEGGGALIIEEREHAIARGARIYCEIPGYGLSNDAYHATQPDPQAGGACRAIRRALTDAQATPQDISYINAHGTSTKYNDLMELTAIRNIYGERAPQIPISSIKSMIGHTLGAAGMIEAIATVLSMHHGFLPPTINHNNPIEGYPFDFVPESRGFTHDGLAASHSFAFGGNAVCLLFSNQTTKETNTAS